MNTQSVVQLTQEQTTAFNALGLSKKFVIKPETTKMRDSSNRLYRGDTVLFHFSPSGPYRYGVITDIEIDGDTWVTIQDANSMEVVYDMNMSSPDIVVILPSNPTDPLLLTKVINKYTGETATIVRIFTLQNDKTYALKLSSGEENNWREDQFKNNWTQQ